MAYVLLALVLVGIWLFCLFDILQTNETEMRRLTKFSWFLVTLLGFLAGAVAWLLVGRRRRRELVESVLVPVSGPIGPDDDPAFLRDLDRRLRGDDT